MWAAIRPVAQWAKSCPKLCASARRNVRCSEAGFNLAGYRNARNRMFGKRGADAYAAMRDSKTVTAQTTAAWAWFWGVHAFAVGDQGVAFPNAES